MATWRDWQRAEVREALGGDWVLAQGDATSIWLPGWWWEQLPASHLRRADDPAPASPRAPLTAWAGDPRFRPSPVRLVSA